MEKKLKNDILKLKQEKKNFNAAYQDFKGNIRVFLRIKPVDPKKIQSCIEQENNNVFISNINNPRGVSLYI